MAKTKEAKAKPKKQSAESANFSEIKFQDYLGKKLVDMSNERGVLTIKFSNGYNIVVKGNISLKKEKEE